MTFRESSVRLLFNVLLVAAVSCRDDSAVAPTARQGAAEPSRAVIAALQAPATMLAWPDTNAVGVSGSPVTGAVSYHFYWSTTPGVVPTPSNRIDTPNNYYTVTPLAPGTYYFVMAGVDGAGMDGPLSAEVYATVSPNIRLTLPSPQALVTTDSVFVQVRATSFWQLASVTASVAGQQKTLSFVAGYWQAWMPLPPGGPVATFFLTVTAVDVQGSPAALSRTFVRDRPPTVVVQSPDDSTFSPGSVRVTATCADDEAGGCVKLEAKIGGVIVATGVSSIDQTVSVAAYDGQTIPVQFLGYDAQKTTIISHSIIVDVNPRLHLLANAAGIILDFVPKRVLVRVTVNGGTELRIQDQTSSTTIWSSTSANQSSTRIREAYLTPKGAIFHVYQYIAKDTIYEWRSGSLLNLGVGYDLVVKGSYAIWWNGPNFLTISQRNLATGVTTPVPGAVYAAGADYDVAKNGVVAYENTSTEDIYRVSGSTTTRLTNGSPPVENAYPLTDGTLFVYQKTCTPSCGQTRIAMHDGSNETILSSPFSGFLDPPGYYYRVSGGWVAYVDAAPGTVQVWTRSPAGTRQQVSFFGTSSAITELSSTGEVVFQTAPARQYRAAPGGAPVDIGGRHTPLFRAGGLYELVGRSLLKVQ
ncbi:MAG: hypothetical protein ABI877_02360 [Gemmatimonadaceae bacterium]